MEKFRLNIDGKEVFGLPGQTILEVARENDIEIPTFCFDERTKIYGACGLCVCEVEGNPKLVKACATDIMPNMVVKTNTTRVIESRKTNLRLAYWLARLTQTARVMSASSRTVNMKQLSSSSRKRFLFRLLLVEFARIRAKRTADAVSSKSRYRSRCSRDSLLIRISEAKKNSFRSASLTQARA